MDPTKNPDAATESMESPATAAAEGHEPGGGEAMEKEGMSIPAPTKPLSPAVMIKLDTAVRALLAAILKMPAPPPPLLNMDEVKAAPRWTRPVPMQLGGIVLALAELIREVGSPRQKDRFAFGPEILTTDAGLRSVITSIGLAAKDKALVAALDAPLRAIAAKAGKAAPRPPEPAPVSTEPVGPSRTMAGRGPGAPMPAPSSPRPTPMGPSAPSSMMRAAR